MPCYTIRLICQEFNGANLKVLEEAAAMLKKELTVNRAYNTAYIGRIVINFTDKTATIQTTQNEQSAQEEINELKRTYSQAAVRIAARTKGWTLENWKTKGKSLTTVATKY